MRQLLVVSSRVKHFAAIQASVHPTVLLLHYKYESCTCQSLLDDVKLLLQGGKVDCVGFVLHGTLTSINICGKDDVTLTKDTLASNERIRHFLVALADVCLNRSGSSRFVWFTTSLGQAADGAVFSKHLHSLLQVPVEFCRDFNGPELLSASSPAGQQQQEIVNDSQLPKQQTQPSCVGELFFRADKLKSLNSSFQQSLAGFEKIRTVGKGAYGTAVLYRKRDDDSLVILKEINLHDLNVAERQMALNEVKVLSMLNHPHVISYYDSFEEDGNMLIEMEYADGGTLSDYLSQLTQPLEERRILEMFQQVVDAIFYVHDHNILHRDIKAANIFLSRDGTLKVGDFGISKVLTTAHPGANTVLGTPYYISPEMCEGKNYDAKSDIWALGCILYEMACLQRTFDGTNLPALVNKIVKGQFAPVKGNYSEQFKQLVVDLLQQDPEKRPSAKVIANDKIPKLLSRLKDSVNRRLSGTGENSADNASNAGGLQHSSSAVSKSSSASGKRIRSVLYYLELTSFGLFPVYLPPKTRIQEVAVGPNHVVVLTADMLVFAWGEGTKGQLGHGDWETRYQPALVESLKDKAIAHVCCGTNFTIFGSANGIVMTCGDGSKGCLGHGEWTNLNKPRLIEALLSVDATSVACGPEHVVVIGTGGLAYAWGQGSLGRLGYGSEENFCSPQRISFPEKFAVKRVRCGSDGTMFITELGVVLATGSNEYNKIGLNNRQGFLMAMKNIFTKTEVDGALTPTVVKSLSQYRIVEAALGPTHTVLLADSGQVICLGRNSFGQLGLGNRREQRRPTVVSKLKAVAHFIGASTTFTVAGSKTSNAVYFWGARRHPCTDGSRRHQRRSRIHSGNSLHRRASSNASTRSGESISDDDSMDSVYCSSSDFEDDGDSLRAMSIAGSKERLQGGTGSAGSERRQSSADRQASANQSSSLQNSSSKVTTASMSVIGAQRSMSAEGLSAAAASSNNPPSAGPSSNDVSNARLQQQQQQRQRLQSFGSPAIPMGSAGSGNADVDEELQIIASPTHILRLQSTGSDEHREIVELSGLHCHGNNLFVHVETTAPPPRRNQAPKPTKEAFKSPKDAPHPLYDGTTSASAAGSSVAGSAESATIARRAMGTTDLNDVPDWLRKELDDAENSSTARTDAVKSVNGSHLSPSSDNLANIGVAPPSTPGVNRTLSIASSLGSQPGYVSQIAVTSLLTTDDDDLSSLAVADDEDDGGSCALTTTDADDEPVLAIKINPQLTRSYPRTAAGSTVGKTLSTPSSRSSVSQQSTRAQSTSRHTKGGSGIPPPGPTASTAALAGERTPRRGHHKSLSVSGLNSTQTPPKYPSSTSTSAASQRPPLSGKVSRTPATPVSNSQRSHRTQSDYNGNHVTTDGGIDSSPTHSVSTTTSASTTRVESLVKELEERYRAEVLLREEIEMLRSQLAQQQQIVPSQSLPSNLDKQDRLYSSSSKTNEATTPSSRPPSGHNQHQAVIGGSSLPITSLEQQQLPPSPVVASSSSSKTLQKQNSVKGDSRDTQSSSGKSEKPASRVCILS